MNQIQDVSMKHLKTLKISLAFLIKQKMIRWQQKHNYVID